jgi:hypothetical protein
VSLSPSWLRMRPVISAAPRYGSTVPNPCFKADVRGSVRPEHSAQPSGGRPRRGWSCGPT